MLWSTIRNYSQRTRFKYPFTQTRVTTTLACWRTRDPYTLCICETVLLQGVLYSQSRINGTHHPFQEDSNKEKYKKVRYVFEENDCIELHLTKKGGKEEGEGEQEHGAHPLADRGQRRATLCL